MTTNATRVLEDALQLETSERVEIAEELLVSLDESSRQEIEAAWAAEIQRRAPREKTQAMTAKRM
jgi:Putative addiction module component